MAQLSFLGAIRTVTGSQYLLETSGHRLLVDCGMFQGEKALRLRNWAEPGFDPAGVEALVITHTHLDHIGRVPRLVRQGFAGRIYCTPATRELAEVLLLDAAHLQQEDAAYLNRKGLTKHSPALPLFDTVDVQAALELFEAVPLGEERQVRGGFRFRYREAGHLLGAASIELRLPADGGEAKVLFSGDVGRFDAVLARDPEPAADADYVVVESTYGNRTHAALPVLDQLEGVLKRTFARGGVLLIPAFAVGRAQQMLWLMDELVTQGRVRPFPIHVDSPMAIDATRIYAQYPNGSKPSLHAIGGRSALHQKWVQLHRTRAESEALNSLKGPAVSISSSGMCSGGRVRDARRGGRLARARRAHRAGTALLHAGARAGRDGRAARGRSPLGMGSVKGLLIDIDGVILRDDQALPGAVALVGWLLETGARFLFLTNYPSQTPADLAGRLAAAGIAVPAHHFFTSAMATAEFLDKQAGTRRRAFVVGEGALVHELYKIGFTMSETEADFVVLGETRHYNFDMIQRAAALIQRGARFVATNPDVAGPAGRPSCGSFAAPIERMTGKTPFYVGKPSPFMMRAGLRQLGLHSGETCMIGDNLNTDVIAGVQSGMETILVLSGVSREADLELVAFRPDHVVRDAAALQELLAALLAGS